VLCVLFSDLDVVVKHFEEDALTTESVFANL
jgi:hypothetical protein